MPARKKQTRRQIRQIQKHKSRNPSKRLKLVLYFLLILTPIVFFAWTFLTSKYWDGVHKLVIAKDKGERVDLEVYDPHGGSITTITIPSDTEVEVAGNLGKWRLKSVSRLGQKEGRGGKLLVDTITKHFKFPVYVWGDFAADNLWDVIRTGETNLGLGDRLRLFYHNLTVKNYKRESVNLAQTKYLKKTTLSDGEEGYELSGKIPTNIAAVFSDREISEGMGTSKIIDRSASPVTSNEVADIVEVLGLKVISVTEEPEQEMDCEVSGKNQEAIEIISRLFGCEKIKSDTDVDTVVTLGTKFAKRF